EALDSSADCYLVQPVHRDDLVAHIRAVVRRCQGHALSLLQIGPIELDIAAQVCRIGGRPIHLTGREYAMLQLLALRKNQTLTKETLLFHLYGGRDEPEIKIIDVFICNIRKKLDAVLGGEQYIETVWGRGYVLRDTPLKRS